MIHYTVLCKADKPQGLLGVDELGRILFCGSTGLNTVIKAFLNQHKNLLVIESIGDSIIQKEIEPKEQTFWLQEFRRQVPAPYYGKPVEDFNGVLDLLTQVWERMNNGKAKDYEITRL